MKQIVNGGRSIFINLYGSRFSVGALYDGLFEECLEGIPILIAHDLSRIIGWSRLFSLYFEPGLTRLVGIGELAENDDDFKQLRSFYLYHLHKSFEAFQTEINELTGELQKHLSGQETGGLRMHCLYWTRISHQSFFELICFTRQGRPHSTEALVTHRARCLPNWQTCSFCSSILSTSSLSS